MRGSEGGGTSVALGRRPAFGTLSPCESAEAGEGLHVPEAERKRRKYEYPVSANLPQFVGNGT